MMAVSRSLISTPPLDLYRVLTGFVAQTRLIVLSKLAAKDGSTINTQTILAFSHRYTYSFSIAGVHKQRAHQPSTVEGLKCLA